MVDGRRESTGSGLAGLVRNLVFLGVLAGLGYFGYRYVMRERRLVETLNEAANAMNEERYAEAVELYEDILARMADGGERLSVARRNAAACHLRLAANPALPLEEMLAHYRAASELDPGCIENPTIRKLLERERQ
jgi:hypothetical protein